MDIPEVNIHGVNRAGASWQNKVTKHANANAPASSKGLLLKQTNNGTIASQTRQHKISTLPQSCYEFSITASIPAGDIVRVLPGVNYSVSASVGVFLCVVTTPDPVLSTAIYTTYGSGSIYDKWTVKPNAQYFPQFPESQSRATSDNPVGRYFELIGKLDATPTSSYKREYNSATTYKYGDEVRKTVGDSQGSWICVATASISGSPPQWPEPEKIGSGSNLWDNLALGANQYSICLDGTSSMVFINSSGLVPFN